MKKINLRQWLGDIDDSRVLLSLNLPGTHDASANFINFSHFSRCQDRNVYEQLNIGVRVLDLRVKSAGNRLAMVHGINYAKKTAGVLAPKLYLSEVLDECYNFLDRNSSETIVIQFKNDNGSEQKKCFELLVEQYIKKAPHRWFTENRVPTLGEVRGKLVLVRRCRKNDKKYSDDTSGIDFSQWVEQDALVPEPLTLCAGKGMEFVIQDRYKYDEVKKWELAVFPLLSSATAFDGRYIVNYLSTAGGIKGPRENAKYINSAFEAYHLDSNKYYGIIYLDFPPVDITRKIIATNY